MYRRKTLTGSPDPMHATRWIKTLHTSTYCTPEVEVAINMGYIIEEIYEVLHWPDTSLHDKSKSNSGLFTKYVNTFLKLKQQSSGFPSNINSEEEKNQYIRMYYENKSILLNKELIKKIQESEVFQN